MYPEDYFEDDRYYQEESEAEALLDEFSEKLRDLIVKPDVKKELEELYAQNADYKKKLAIAESERNQLRRELHKEKNELECKLKKQIKDFPKTLKKELEKELWKVQSESVYSNNPEYKIDTIVDGEPSIDGQIIQQITSYRNTKYSVEKQKPSIIQIELGGEEHHFVLKEEDDEYSPYDKRELIILDKFDGEPKHNRYGKQYYYASKEEAEKEVMALNKLKDEYREISYQIKKEVSESTSKKSKGGRA